MKYLNIFVFLLVFYACGDAQHKITQQDQMQHPFTNSLINESSPYLLQHAHNPVDWMPWGDEALEKAKAENKPLLISIGYSACHWCHVMEHESFEDTAVANLMNAHFVCIKIDREERPDIDQVYMNAVQLMTGRGGWPLNCFATPDGRPFFGGTYYPRDNWINILNQIKDVYQKEPQKVEEYANKLTEGVRTSDLIERNVEAPEYSLDLLNKGLANWQSAFDPEYGGNNQAPKFPIPSNYQFLLHYYYTSQDPKIKDHLLLSLEKIAYGGIYDQIGGGFARYSTDMEWKVPHFEKMLYDNAQLISLYSQAYRLEKNPTYKQVVTESIAFVEEELMAENGAFYSALDADSEGEEGKYYVWKKGELKELLGADFRLAADYFNINEFGYWEDSNYVLIRDKHNEELAKFAGLELIGYEEKIEGIKAIMKKERSKRIKPGLDDKSLTSWNALMIKGLVDAYLSFEDAHFLELAEQNANFILSKQKQENGALWHSYKEGRSSINGYLEDYCFSIEAFIALYQATFDEKWLQSADELADFCMEHFFDNESGMFYFTDKDDQALIARKMEVSDNVIPASNSSMAIGLYKLGKYLEKEDYLRTSKQMLDNIIPQFSTYLPGYSNWAQLLMFHTQAFYEVAICGKEAREKAIEMNQNYFPNMILLGTVEDNSSLTLLELKYTEGQTTIYVCENKVCQLPVTETKDAKLQLKP